MAGESSRRHLAVMKMIEHVGDLVVTLVGRRRSRFARSNNIIRHELLLYAMLFAQVGSSFFHLEITLRFVSQPCTQNSLCSGINTTYINKE